MSLYHCEVGFPSGIEFKPLFGFRYSGHAREEAARDNITELPQNFLPRKHKVVEIETDSKGELEKIVYRKQLDRLFDAVIVLLVKEKLVKTIWLNSRLDRHFTLDRSRYDRP